VPVPEPEPPPEAAEPAADLPAAGVETPAVAEIAEPPGIAVPAPAEQPAAPAVPAASPSGEAAAGQTFSIPFDPGEAQLSQTAGALLAGIVQRMADDEATRLLVNAYAGSGNGTASRTRGLSLDRALAVRSYFLDRGIAGTRIDVRALGDTAEGEPRDRVDLVLAR
jgi:outer membrane protein OmpA-like peptidoglycan-associated protein